MMPAKESRVLAEQVPMFEEFHGEDKKYREFLWNEQQSQPPAETPEGRFRGWLEGKPNPVLRELPTPYAKEDMGSPSGTKLADVFPGPKGTTYQVADASLTTERHRHTYTDKLAVYPKEDRGNVQRIRIGGCCNSVFRRRMFTENQQLLANAVHKVREVMAKPANPG